MDERPKPTRRASTRTCAGCGGSQTVSGDASDLLRLVVAGAEVAFDLAGGAFGRGAYVHARPDCLAKAPRGLARSFGRGARARSAGERSDPGAGPRHGDHDGAALALASANLGERLVVACSTRMTGLLLAARRLGALAIGSDAAREALARGMRALELDEKTSGHAAPLGVVAVDAGSVAQSVEVTRAVAAGHAIAWSTKLELGALLGEQVVAICTVRHESIAAELKRMHAAADAGAAVTR